MAMNVSLDCNNLLRIALVATERTAAFLVVKVRRLVPVGWPAQGGSGHSAMSKPCVWNRA